jgi:riboflavin synthase alpha subunit
MFTGLVQELGTVLDIARNESNAVITIKAAQLAGSNKARGFSKCRWCLFNRCGCKA